MFTEPSSEEVIRNTMPISQKVWPSVGMAVASGEIGGPARLRRAAGNEEAGEHHHTAQEINLVARHVQRGNAMSMAPICSGTR
jgi:hypothetical protein